MRTITISRSNAQQLADWLMEVMPQDDAASEISSALYALLDDYDAIVLETDDELES